MNNIPRTAAQIRNSISGQSQVVAGTAHASDALTTVDARTVEWVPEPGHQTLMQRLRYTREMRRVVDSYTSMLIDAKVRVIVAGVLDRIDAANDSHNLQVLIRKAVHGERLVAAAQRNDEKLMAIEESCTDRWNSALARRILELAALHADGTLTDADLRQQMDAAVIRYQQMQQRVIARVDTIRQGTDALIDFGRGPTTTAIK